MKDRGRYRNDNITVLAKGVWVRPMPELAPTVRSTIELLDPKKMLDFWKESKV